MPVNKRLRFEILRRDNHACRYCGATAPDAKLTVDHVVPSALGGADEPGNLVTACAACNSGKTSSSPDAPLVAGVADDAIRWAAAIRHAAAGMLADLERRQAMHDQFKTRWDSWAWGDPPKPIDLPADWRATVDQFVGAGLPLPLFIECVDIAMSAGKVRLNNVFRYMCGVAWKRVSALQESARAAVSEEDDIGEYSVLDILDECVIKDVVKAAGGDEMMGKIAAQCMWEVASAGARGWKRAIADGRPEDAFEDAQDEASSSAAYYLNAIAERAQGVL